MNTRYFDVLEICLSEMEQGAELESCLSRYPELAPELRPILDTARLAQELKDESVPEAAVQRSRTRLLSEAARLRSQESPKRTLRGLPRFVLATLAVIFVLFLSWRGLVVTSAKSLPGDPLYNVKRAAENVSLSVVPNNEAKLNFQAEINERRVSEVITLLRLGRVEPVQFEGIVIERSPGHWVVDGVPVNLNDGTVVTGPIENGMVVEVVGLTQPEGWVEAESIWLHSYELVGKVESITQFRWVISGVELQVSKISQIDPAIRIGDTVIVLVEFEQGQVLHAEAILRLLQPSIVDKIEASPTQQLTPSAAPTQEPPLVLKDVEFSGIVDSISSNEWEIDGTRIRITQDTEIKDEISVGDRVKVQVRIGQDGTILALEIELELKLDENESEDKNMEPGKSGTDDNSIGSEEDHLGSGEDDDEGIGSGSDDGSGGEDVGSDYSGETIDGSEDENGDGDNDEDSSGEHIGDSDDSSDDNSGEESGGGDGGDDVEPDDGEDGGKSGENGGDGGEYKDGGDQEIEPNETGSRIEWGEDLGDTKNEEWFASTG